MLRTWRFALPLLLFGALLRFHALDRQSLWDDEVSSIHTMSAPPGMFLEAFRTFESHPPLYFIQLKIWHALGMKSLVKLRANSAVWAILSLVLAYMLGKLYGGEEAGLLAAAFLTLSPFHLAYSQELRPYAMAMAIALGALLTLERRQWTWLTVLWTAQIYTHYWGAFVIFSQAVYGYFDLRTDRDKKRLLRTVGIVALLFIPWLPILHTQMGIIDRLAFWVPRFSFESLYRVFLAYAGFFFNMASWTFYLPTQVWVYCVLGLVFMFAFVMGLIRGPRAAMIWLFLGLGIPWLLSAWKPAIFVWYRYPVHMLPAFALLIAAGLTGPVSRAPHPKMDRFLHVTIALLILGSQAWGTWTYFHHWQKANPKAVVSYIHFMDTPETVVVRPAYFTDLFSFYDQGRSRTLDEHALDSKEKRAALKGKNVILVAFDVPSDPIADAFLEEYATVSARYFPGTAHLGITVYQLK